MEICDSTKGQTDNESWWNARKGRLTASKFGRLMSARSTQSLQNLKKDINCPPNSIGYRPKACQMGLNEEENAKQAYINYQKEHNGAIVSIRDVGLCVPNWNRSIGSSPDGIVNVSGQLIPHILEIKCIYDKEPLPRTIEQVAKDRGSSFYCKVDSNGEFHLKKNHAYYYQVLGEMAVTGLLQADFVIYHPRTAEIKVLRIPFDDDDWKRVKERLETFDQMDES